MRSVLISSSQTQVYPTNYLWENTPSYPQVLSKTLSLGTNLVFLLSLYKFVAQTYASVFNLIYRFGCFVLPTIHSPNNKNNKGD